MKHNVIDQFIPFHLADPAGIVFFAHVFTLCHQAYEKFVTTNLAFKWQEWFQNPEWILPIRATHASYQAPLFAGQECHIHLALSKLTPSSFTLSFQFLQPHLCCEVTTTHVCCTKLTQTKRELPLVIRERLIENFDFALLHQTD